LDELFGARESYVEFTPDLLGDLRLSVDGLPAWGGIFMQAYQPTTGKAVGWYEDGSVAAVDHSFGQGRTRLIGTMVGAGHGAHADGKQSALSSPFFASLLSFAGQDPSVRSSDVRIKARLHNGAGGVYLWVANPTRQALPVRLELGKQLGPYTTLKTCWGAEAQLDNGSLTLTVPARDMSVLELIA
jgi:beta-galactosidase